MVDLSTAQEYIKLFKNLQSSLPQLEKSESQPNLPESKNNVVDFLWNVKLLYGKIKENKDLNIPQIQFLDALDKLPNDKEAFAKQVRENMLEIRNNKLHITSAVGESQPIGDFSNDLLNQIENWGLALLGTFGKG
jgi:hypothetical protein